VTQTQMAALLGFAFVAVWIADNFGSAVLCLLGAGVFAALAALYRGELDLNDLQERLGQRRQRGGA
jgi:hypothetical protein